MKTDWKSLMLLTIIIASSLAVMLACWIVGWEQPPGWAVVMFSVIVGNQHICNSEPVEKTATKGNS